MRVLQLRGSDDGAVAVFVAILSVLLLGLAAFAVDLGSAYAAKRQLSVAADAAALDAANAVNAAIPAGAGCSPAVLASVGAQAKATAAATTTNGGNDKTNSASIESVDIACNANRSVEVTVVNSREIPSTFGSVLGVSKQVPRRTATASIYVPTIATGLRPFAACSDDLVGANGVIAKLNAIVGAVPQYGSHFVVWISKDQSVCGASPGGQWGFANFLDQGAYGDFNDVGSPAYNPASTCGGGSPSSGGNAGCQSEWVDVGYNGGVTIPNLAVGGNTGLSGNSGLANSAAYRDALDALVGDVIQLPVATSYANGNLNVTGVVSARVCAVKQSPGSITSGSCYAPVGATNPLTGKNLNPWAGFKNNEGALQVEFVGYSVSSVAAPNASGCALNDKTCDFGTRAVTLYK